MSEQRNPKVLQEEAQRLAEQAEKQSDQPTPSASSPIPSPSVSPAVPSTSPSQSLEVPTPSASVSVPTPSASQEVPKEEKKEEKKPAVPAEKFAASTREAQRLYKDNVHMSSAIADANALPEPTEEELKGAYTSWEDMTDGEKTLAKESFVNKRFREHVAQAATEVKKVQDWSDKVDEYVQNPENLQQYPDLEGKETEFTTYANDKTKVQPGTDFKLIVGAFLYEQSKVVKPTNKGEMFPTSTSGPKEQKKQSDGKISLADAEILKQTNYTKYKELLRAGKIATDDV